MPALGMPASALLTGPRAQPSARPTWPVSSGMPAIPLTTQTQMAQAEVQSAGRQPDEAPPIGLPQAGPAEAGLPGAVSAIAVGGMASSPMPDVSPHSTLFGQEPASATPHDTDHGALDQLTHQLYDRVRSQLAAELLVGRERSQLLTDLG
jgi:hypothetical protein